MDADSKIARMVRVISRRNFVRIVGILPITLPAMGHAQSTTAPLIGFLSSRSPEDSAGHLAAFLSGLKAFGYVDGRSTTIEYRWANGHYDQLGALANELVAMHPAILIAAGGTPSARAAKSATSSIPVLFVTSNTGGLVKSLSRPGGNASGVDLMTGTLGAKRLELLVQLVPKAEVIGLLTNPQGEDAGHQAEDVRGAARTLGRRLFVAGASNDAELEQAFLALVSNGVKALVVENDPSFDARRDHIMALAAAHRIAAIYHIREFPSAGGLMSYGPSLVDGYYQLGVQAGRVLKGANVADLPVVRSTKFELVINLKTAGSLGLTVPPALLAQADGVIE